MEKPQWAGILHFQTDWNPLPMISLELTMVRKASGSSRRRKSRSSPACRRVSATMIMVRGSPVYTPEIFLLAAQKLGTAPAHTLVLEDSFNGVRAGAAGGFVTVMVPDFPALSAGQTAKSRISAHPAKNFCPPP